MNPELEKTFVTKKVNYNPFAKGPLVIAIPTTESQREMWASLAMDDNATLCYNESIVLDLNGNLDEEILNKAFQEVLKRHDALRSIFSGDGKTFFIPEFKTNAIQVKNVFNDEELEKYKHSEINTKFDLVNGPCIRGSLLRFSPVKSFFIITAHHLICDGWSFAVILSELSDFYNLLLENKSLPQSIGNQFSSYAIEESKGSQTDDSEYWLNEFSQTLRLRPIPIDSPRPAFRTYNSSRFDKHFSSDLVKGLKRLSAKEGCSLYTVLMGIHNILLYKLTKSPEIVTGMASASQSTTGRVDLVGHLVNLLPLRMPINGKESFSLFLKSLRGKMLDAFEHQNFGYGKLVKALNIKRSPSEIPLLNVVFNIDQQYPGQGLRFKTLEASYTTTPRSYENFELFFNAVSCEDQLVIECQFNDNLFQKNTISNWLESFQEICELVILNPKILIDDVELPNLKISAAPSPELSTRSLVSKRDAIVEEKLNSIWGKVLKLENIKPEDNFFSLGGHSLLAVEMTAIIREEFKKPFSVRDIFEAPTILEMASILSSKKESSDQLFEIMPTKITKGKVSHNQMQIWYLEEIYPGTNMHNLPASIRLKFKVDPRLLEKTMHHLVERHEAFRTSIIKEHGEPFQRVSAYHDMILPKLEVVSITEENMLQELQAESKTVFNKEIPPLYKAKLFKLGEADYVFFFMVHHAVWDGWSFDIFFEELDLIYSSLVKNEPFPLCSINVRYLDFTESMHSMLLQGKLNPQLDYWKNKLRGELPTLDLPTDFKRPLIANHMGASVPFTIPEKLELLVRDFAKNKGTSVFNVLLTAFKITLSRYSGINDIIVGTPVRARNNPNLLKTIGYFVNTVALRTKINLENSFEDILKGVSSVGLEAFSNQDIPFQVVLNTIEHSKDSSRTPVFQTFFSYQDVSNRESKLNGHKYSQINIDKASTHTDLDLWIKTSNSKIEGAFEYRTDLFKEITIERFKDCFLFILHGLFESQDVPLIKLPSLPIDQRELILKSWNASTSKESVTEPFIKIFEANAIKYPNKVCIKNSQGEMTYSELDKLSNKCAHALLKTGVKPGDFVGIYHSRDLNLLVSLLATLKVGAGYIPLDPSFPKDRLDYMVANSHPRVILTERTFMGSFTGNEKIVVEELLSRPNLPDTVAPIVHDLSHPMYVIYTSGSTGNPKGVQISHRAMINFLTSMKQEPGISETDKVLAVTTLSFDIATLELYLPLMVGGSIYLASSYDVLDGASLKEIIENEKITFMQATPSTWRLLLAAGWQGSKKFKLLCGGEPFPKDLAHKLTTMTSEVWNMYGPTETTVWSTCKKITSDSEEITIGRPINNTYAYILEESLELSPIGKAGELYLGGVGLADGYFGRKDLTQEKFIPNPFRPGEKMYATGDYARFLSDGDIMCLGRRDGQVKIRGYRIELGEIENALSKINGISEASVITHEYKKYDVRIVAFIVSNGLDERALRDELSINLPKYMIPSHFVFLDKLPKTLNGKIDKKSLPSLLNSSTEERPVEVSVSHNVSTDPLEVIWQSVLGVKSFPKDVSFFDLGGNSLLAVQMYSKIAKEMGLDDLPLSLLLQNSNFNQFSEALTPKKTLNVPTVFKSLIAINAQGNKTPLFCFHGVGGNVLNYINLSPNTNGHPLYALQSRGLDGSSTINSIEKMASEYIKEIKVIQPHGPYLLAGGSMGGMIALETALQLNQRGDQVEKLILFDTFGPDINIRSYDKSERSFWKNLKISLYYRRRMLINSLQVKLLGLFGLTPSLESRLFDLEMTNYRALWKYRPAFYQGDLHLIRGKSKNHGWYSDPLMGWQNTIGGEIKTYEIEGTHNDFIESPELGSVLRRLL